MKGYTRPPRGVSFREKKFLEANAREIFNKTLFFTDAIVTNSGATQTDLFSYEILPKSFTGNGESISAVWGGRFSANANLKTLAIVLTDIYGDNVLWSFSSASAAIAYFILEIDLFSQYRSTSNFGANIKFFNEDPASLMTLRSYQGGGTDFSDRVTLKVQGTGVATGDLRVFQGKGVFVPAP